MILNVTRYTLFDKNVHVHPLSFNADIISSTKLRALKSFFLFSYPMVPNYQCISTHFKGCLKASKGRIRHSQHRLQGTFFIF